jgi:hypothetical protein
MSHSNFLTTTLSPKLKRDDMIRVSSKIDEFIVDVSHSNRSRLKVNPSLTELTYVTASDRYIRTH